MLGLSIGLGLLELWHSKAFDRAWNAGLLHKLKSYGISDQVFSLIFSFHSNIWLCVVLDGKPSREYQVCAGVREGSILAHIVFLLYINDLTDDVICKLLSIITQLSTLSVIRPLTCVNSQPRCY